RIVQKETFGRWRHPRLEQRDELSAGNHWRSILRQSINNTGAIRCGAEQQIGIAANQRTLDLEFLNLFVDDKPPRKKFTARKPQTNAIVGLKILRPFRCRMSR